MNNIYLIGMMGSGKSVTGKALADITRRSWLDFDQELERRLGMSVTEVFKVKGEVFFRGEEGRVLEELSRKNNQIISTGGGIILRAQNVLRMKATGKVFFLKTSAEGLWERLKHKTDRPLLAGENPKEKLETILKERERHYLDAADFEIETDGKSALDVASEIKEKLSL